MVVVAVSGTMDLQFVRLAQSARFRMIGITSVFRVVLEKGDGKEMIPFYIHINLFCF
jgi:hypothetical protein